MMASVHVVLQADTPRILSESAKVTGQSSLLGPLPAVKGAQPRHRAPETERRLREAKFAHAVIQAVRATIHSRKWQHKHNCTSLQQVWRFWIQAASEAGSSESHILPALGTTPAAAPSCDAVSCSSKGVPVSTPRSCATVISPGARRKLRNSKSMPQLIRVPPAAAGLRAAASRATAVSHAAHAIRTGATGKKLDSNGLRLALAVTFPEGKPLSDEEIDIVYRSLDATNRGYVTLSTFSSVFSARRGDKQRARQQYYQALPTWGETIGGYIPKNEKEQLLKREITLQHGNLGREMLDEVRGVAGGFGLGHCDWTADSLGWEMLGHADLNANVLKWGEYKKRPPPPPPPPKLKLKPKPVLVPKPKPPPRPPKPEPAPKVDPREIERRFRRMMARKVQRSYRLHLVLLNKRRQLEQAMHEAAVRLQSRVRAQQTSRVFQTMRNSSIHVQKAIRTMLQRLNAAAALKALRELQRKSATIIQSATRMWLFRRVIATVRVQRSFRAHLCRKLLKSLRSVRIADDQKSQALQRAQRAAEQVARMQQEMEDAQQAAQEAQRLEQEAGLEASRLKHLTGPKS